MKTKRKKLRRYEYNFGGFLKKLAPAAVTAGVSAIPGVGPALAPIAGSMTSAAVNSGADGIRNPNINKRVPYSPSSTGYKYGGKMKYVNGGNLPVTQPLPGGAKKYNGPKHEQGGIPIDQSGNPTSPNQATAEVEGGETEQDGYVFSDSLTVPGTQITFAEAHERMVAQGVDKQQIMKLRQLQEKAQKQAGVQGGDDQGQSWGQQGYARMRGGGHTKKKYQNGGSVLATGAQWANKMSTDEEYGFGEPGLSRFDKAMQTAGYVVPSLTRGAMALTAPKVKDSPKVRTGRVPVQSSVFSDTKRKLAGDYRSIISNPNATPNQKLAAQSQLQKGRSEIAGKEADYRGRQQQFNVKSGQQADMANVRSFQLDREAKGQEEAARKKLLTQAIEMPITAYNSNKAGEREQIANVMIDAGKMSDPVARKRHIQRSLRGIGLSNKEIQRIMRTYNY